MTSAQRAYNRDPSDIHIAILTQSESQSTGLSIITATVDSQAPELSNIATHVTAPFFVQQSSDTYKASNVTITMFINILIGVKANGWTLMGTNAFLNSAKQEVVKTFYFEKVSGRSNSSSSSSSGSVGVRQVAQSAGKGAQLVTTPVSSSNHNNNNNNNDNAGEVEDKTSAEAVEHRIASIMAAQSARKSFLQQQQQTSSSSSSSSGRNNEGDVVATSPLGPILNITPRVKTTTPGARPAGGAASGGVGGGGGAGGGTEMQKKNAEYFRRMKAEQDLEKKKLEEQEAKLDEAEQRRLKEQRALQEAHDASKTAHFSRLGATFVNTQGVFASKRPPI